MIASYLYIKKIPFRYECALYLNGVLVFPDFTIRHPKTGEVYYWEHFGLIDQPSYVKRTMEKIYGTQWLVGAGLWREDK